MTWSGPLSGAGRALAIIAVAGLSLPRPGYAQHVQTPYVQAKPAAPHLAARDGSPILVRAVGQTPSRELVQLVGRSAASQQLSLAQRSNLEGATAGQVAISLCGSVQDGYIDLIAELNPGAVVPAGALGALVYELNWPACLYTRTNVDYLVQANDTLSSIRGSFTGSYDTGPLAQAFFEGSGIRYLSPGRPEPGVTIVLPFSTQMTALNVETARKPAVLDDLQRVGGDGIQINSNPVRFGEIVGPYKPATSQIQSATSDCVSQTPGAPPGDDPYPFNPTDVRNAYGWLKGVRPLETVTIAIVDNGFMGVPCDADGCPGSDKETGIRYSPRFPKKFFASPMFYRDLLAGSVGPNLPAGFDPILYREKGQPKIPVNDVSGHGTHVAGLVLGGPMFEQYRDVLMDSADANFSRIQISIFAVANGTENLAFDADLNFNSYLEQAREPSIVNLSIAFDGNQRSQVEDTLRRVIEGRIGTLFVAAAGNLGEELTPPRYFPATLGGPQGKNLITVGSVDADGVLSDFSNRGAADVDLAAPGCRIVSWLTADSEAIPISGTSQAAPLVTFSAALLRSSWQYATPREIKNRLIYSGDLLADAKSRDAVASKSRLNIQKALFYPRDYLRYRSQIASDLDAPVGAAAPPLATQELTLLGDITEFRGWSCGSAIWRDLRAMKRLEDRMFIFVGSRQGEITVCDGQLRGALADDVPNVVLFKPIWQVRDGVVSKYQGGELELEIPASDIQEIIRAN